jgi:transcriptional regulator GlxA family with amidase domain
MAEELLRDSDLKLEAVAHRLGFASGAHFSTWFRRLRRVSPRTFRGNGRSLK